MLGKAFFFFNRTVVIKRETEADRQRYTGKETDRQTDTEIFGNTGRLILLAKDCSKTCIS